VSMYRSIAAPLFLGALSLLLPQGAAAQSLSLPTIGGIGGGSQTTAVIVECGPGTIPGSIGDSGTPSGNCSCSETGEGSVSCSCSSSSSGAGATAAGGSVSGLIVKAVYASAEFDEAQREAITSAATCADAVVELQSSPGGSFGRTKSGECQLSAGGQGVWYSCVY